MNRTKTSSNKSGVSEVIGTILLLGISVTLFSVIYISVLSFPGAPSTPSSNIAYSINETSLILTHVGGKPLDLDSKVKIIIDDVPLIKTINEYLDEEANIDLKLNITQDNYWGFGEYFIIDFTDDVEDAIEVMVIDVDSNSLVMSGKKIMTNRPPIISSPVPYNSTEDVPIDISELHITISDPDTDALKWNIETNPDVGSQNNLSEPGETGGIKTCTISGLTYHTTYTWYVNATDINGHSTNKTYIFTTADIGVDHKDAIDSNTSNEDSSVDKGNETSFTNAKDNITDNNVMNIQESDYGNQDYKDDVDSASSNVDSSADKGTEINFANSQGTSPDTNIMTIQEANHGYTAVNENKIVTGFTDTAGAWAETGSSPYLGTDDGTNYIRTKTSSADEYWFTFADTTATGAGFTVVMYTDFNEGDGDDDVNWYIDTTGDNTPEFSGQFVNPTTNVMNTGTISGLDTAEEINAARVWFKYVDTGTKNYITIDYAYINIQRPTSANYNIDLEYQWTTANYSDGFEYLCFNIASHPVGTETLNVYYRNGAAWTSLGTITTIGWTNFTATGLTSGTYTIRLLGSSESGDTTQDTWNIDCIFLHTYNSSNYKIDFEYQWTNAHYSDTTEQVCMYITSTTGTETLNVNYRNGASWTSLGTITGTGWVNISATGLSSSTYTIQLIGATEINDTTRDTWTIDCIYLHTWT